MRYAILDGFCLELVEAARQCWPGQSWSQWLHYDSPLERKRTCNHWPQIPQPCQLLLGKMATLYHPLLPGIVDLSLYGSGMCDMRTGDELTCHLDADRHQRLNLERTANAILFLTDFQPDWGGQLELWQPDLSGVLASIIPAAGRLVLFETNATSYHRVTRLACPRSVVRSSLSLYWWKTSTEPSRRPRAQFVALPGEPFNANLEQLRQERGQ